MSRKYLIRITELERLLSEQAEALRQRDLQLSLVEETEAFLRSALARAEEKIEEEEREIEYLRAQIEKLRRMLFGTRSEKLQREVEQAEAQLKQREQESDRYSGREDDPQVPRQLRQSRHRRPLPAHLPRGCSLLPPVNPGYPSQNLLLKMALTPICCSNGDNNGARESCYYLLQRAPSYFL